MQVVNLVDVDRRSPPGVQMPLCITDRECEPEGLAIVPVAHNAPDAADPIGGLVRPSAADPPRGLVRCVHLLSEYMQDIIHYMISEMQS